MNQPAKTLFQLQAELLDSKVDKAVNQAISQVVEQIESLKQEMQHEIGGLKNEMHGLRHEMNSRFSSLENRMVAVETRLGMDNELRREFRTRFFDYGFKAAWLLFGVAISWGVLYFHKLL
ncbi:MAG: hypothetical protein WBE18_02775 [Gammaproteobacteria bacterium]